MPLDNQMLQDFMALSPEEQAKVTGNPGAPVMLKDFAALPHEERLKVLSPSTSSIPPTTVEGVRKELDPYSLLDPRTAVQVIPPIVGSMYGGPVGAGLGMAGGYVGSQLLRGEPINPKTAVLEGLLGLIPFGGPAKTAVGTIAKRAAQGATFGAGATTLRKGVEEGQLPSLEELIPSLTTGGLVGLVGGGVERYLQGRVPPKVTPTVEPVAGPTKTPLALPPVGGTGPSIDVPQAANFLEPPKDFVVSPSTLAIKDPAKRATAIQKRWIAAQASTTLPPSTGRTFMAGPQTMLERVPLPEPQAQATSSFLAPRTPEELAMLEQARLITTGVPLTDEQIIRARAKWIDTGIKPAGFGDINEPAFSTPGATPSPGKVERFQPKPQGTYVNITPEGTSSELGPVVPPTTKPMRPPSTFAKTVEGVSETTGVPPTRVFPARQASEATNPSDIVEFGLGIKIPDKWKGKLGKNGVIPGVTRLYRADTSSSTKPGVPDWVKQTEEYTGIKGATGRWFSDTYDNAKYYADKFGNGKITYVDIPTTDLEKYRASNLPEGKFSAAGRAKEEFFVPKDIASTSKPIQAPNTVEFGLGIKIPDKWKGKFKEGVKAYLSSGQIQSLAKDTEGVHAVPPATPTNPTPISAFEVAQDKLVEGLRRARSARTETTGIQSVERSKRLGAAMRIGEEIPGREGFYAQKGALKGVLPQADFAPVELDEKTIGDLFTGVRTSKRLEGFDKIAAQEGLENLFGIGGGKIPTDSQINLLRRVLKPEVLDQMVKERTTLQSSLDHVAEALGFSKAMMAMGDMSAFRQAFPLLTAFPKQFRKAWVAQHKYFVNDDSYQAAMKAIEDRTNFPLYEKMNLALTGIGGGRLGHEERFFAQLPTKIPIIRTVYKASERAYEGMLTQLRADAADEMLKRATQSGQNITPEVLTSIGSYINNFSGRGSLGPMSASAGTLTTLLFSPRLLASRFNTLLNPAYYAGLEPVVRKQALKSALGTFTLGTTVLGLAGAAGLDVGTDPRSADFGKIKVGNTRISVFGGYEQYPRLLAQLFTGEIVSSTSSKTIKMGETPVSPTRKSVVARFLENKEAPVPAFISRWLEGKNIAGEPFNPTPEFFKMFTQMVTGDIIDIYNDDPTLLPLAGLGWYGVNLQTYGPKNTGAGVVSPPQ